MMSTQPSSGPGKMLTWKHIGKRAVWLTLYPALFISLAVMRSNPGIAEQFYASSVFPPVRNALGALFSVFPFSFAEFLLYALIAALAALVVFCCVQGVRRRLSVLRLISVLMVLGIIVGAGLNAFYWLWGFNYYRSPLAERMGLQVAPVGKDELAAVCALLAESANTLREGLAEDENGVFRYNEGNEGILASVPAAYENAARSEAALSAAVHTAKPVAASHLLSTAGIAGIFIPFTEEANVNMDATPLLIAASAAHESAHYLGIAREEEANFAAYLACAASDDPQVRYSGTMLALIHAGNALADTDKAEYARLWSSYSDAVIRDLRANSAYVEENSGTVSEKASEMNDKYLRANAQPSGVRSYGEMVNLLVAYFRQNGSI